MTALPRSLLAGAAAHRRRRATRSIARPRRSWCRSSWCCSSPASRASARSVVERPGRADDAARPALALQRAGAARQARGGRQGRSRPRSRSTSTRPYPLVRERAIKLAPSTLGAAARGEVQRGRTEAAARLARVAGEQEVPAARPEMQQRVRAEAGGRIARRGRAEAAGARRPDPRHPRRAAGRRRRGAGAPPRRRRHVGPASGSRPTRSRPPWLDRSRPRAEICVAARADRRGRPRAARAAEPARRRRPSDRRAQARRRLAGVPPRARGPGDRRPEGAQPRPAEDRQRRADLARDHVGLPGARDAARAWPTSARPAPSASRPRSATSARRIVRRALRQHRRGVPRHRRAGARRLRRGAGRELHRRRGHALARPVPARRRCIIVGETSLCVRHNLLRRDRLARRHRGRAAPIRRRWPSATAGSATTCRTPSGAPVSSNAEGARLAGHRPGAGRHRQRARRQRVRPARRRPGDPGRRRTTAPASPIVAHPQRASAAARPRATTAPAWSSRCRTGPAPCTTCWCR